MHSITVTYRLKWRISIAPKLGVTQCGKVFNIRTGRQKKLTVNSKTMTKGYWIGREFYSLVKLRPLLEIIKPEFVPF
jgi:hypothetical protein